MNTVSIHTSKGTLVSDGTALANALGTGILYATIGIVLLLIIGQGIYAIIGLLKLRSRG